MVSSVGLERGGPGVEHQLQELFLAVLRIHLRAYGGPREMLIKVLCCILMWQDMIIMYW